MKPARSDPAAGHLWLDAPLGAAVTDVRDDTHDARVTCRLASISEGVAGRVAIEILPRGSGVRDGYVAVRAVRLLEGARPEDMRLWPQVAR